MEELAGTERTAPAAAAVEGTRVRRRLVQSMLFPHNNGQIAMKEQEEEEEEVEEEEEEDEWCGSQGSGRGKRRKQNQTRNSKPRASQKKVKANGKDTSQKKEDDRDSSDIAKSDFFLKVSERQHQKRERKEQVYAVSDGVDDNVASPPTPAADTKTSRQAKSTPKKQRMNTTPKKKAMSSGSKGVSSRQTSTDLTKDEPTLQTTPDLRLEAKVMAEENSRLYAGRQIHPFFSSWKVDKKKQDIIDLETEQCSSEKEGKEITFNPVHVFERVENDAVALDWGHWTFSDASFVYGSCGLESGGSNLYEGSVNSLLLDNFSYQTSIGQNEISMDSSLHKEDQGTNEINDFHDNSSCTTYDAEWQGRFCRGSCQNCLWTDKYQPRKATQVCGNGEAVKHLSEWLHLWHARCSQTSRSVKRDDKSIAEDDFNYNQSDCDSDDTDEETALGNVLLVTGPVGSGKSASIYACAKEQGFQVIEINASDWRNGALVKQKFGEAVESHWLQGSMGNSPTPKSKHLSKSSPVVTSKGSENVVIDFIPLPDEEGCEGASAGLRESFCSENKTANNQNKNKTLILFEDVDATLYEDSGFISTIQQLAKTAKRPMILTSNSENPLLPSNLDRLHLCFTLPSLDEIIGLANVVCAAENAKIRSSMVEYFVDLCQRDIRKTIMNLQFWCQGQDLRRGKELQNTRSPFPFDLDASHRVFPKIIPWGYPSPLSELVEEEITKSLMMMEENHKPIEINREEELNDRNLQNGFGTPNGKQGYIEAKKDALLSLHCSTEDDYELAVPSDTNCDFYSSLDSPVADTQPGVRRKFNAVIFSDSEEDYFTDRKPVALRRMLDDADDEADVKITAPSPSLLGERWCSPSTEHLNHFEGEKLEETFCPHAETTDCSHINGKKSVDGSWVHCSHMNDTCKSVDISCVPESSIVPETEFDNQTCLSSPTVSFGHASCRAATDSMRNDPLSSSFVPIEVEEFCKSLHALDGAQDIIGSSSHFCTISVNREMVGDSQFDNLVDVPIGYQVLDECSRMDFIRRFKSSQNIISHQRIDFVQDAWRKLRDCKMDLRHYVTSQEKDAFQVMKVTSGLSNLISDADLLLSNCQPLLCDFLDPPMIPCDKSQSYSWHDDQLQMTSIFAEHGICFYAKETTALGSKVGSINRVDLAWEMLASSANTMALGKLVSQERKCIDRSEMRLPGSCFPLRSKMNSRLINVLQCVVPSKSYLSLHSDACYEYLSSLSQISRLQASLSPECVNKRKQRRTRVARHYLHSGAFALTPEDVSFLGECNYYQKASSQSDGANFR